MADLVPAPEAAVTYESRVDTVATLEAAATRKGLVIRYPEPNELFVDIDSPEQYAAHRELLEIFRRHQACEWVSWPSPSGKAGREHIVVTMDRPVKDAAERVMLQSLLGSDPKREALSWLRIQRGCEDKVVSVFFEKPAELKCVV